MLKKEGRHSKQKEKEEQAIQDYELKIAKLIRDHNGEVNELEQKLQYERIGVQTIKNAQNTEIRDLRKEVTDLNFKLRQAEMQSVKKSNVKANPNAAKSRQIDTKNASTQTNKAGAGKGAPRKSTLGS